jgi:hypothetical protein|tara:strand:+ start:219 stop:557 length:339 start_codon:yes stop_codon:yes gene_type:complete
MSVVQNVIALYGWITPTSPAVAKWAEDLDYQLPEGILLLGMDSREVGIGIKLFDSGTPRWGPMDGDSASFREIQSANLLDVWQHANWKLFVELFYLDLADIAPKYHIFINHS